MASALSQMKQLIGLLETALHNANTAEAKGNENEQAINGNDECIMELAEIISGQEECIMELAEIVSNLAE